MDASFIIKKIRHYRTTIAGVATILGAVITFISMWAQSGVVPTADKWEALGAALVIGAGLISSADAKTVNKIDAKVEAIKEEEKT